MQTFEEYLQIKFFKDEAELCTNKDAFVANYENWITEMDADTWIKYATEWHNKLI